MAQNLRKSYQKKFNKLIRKGNKLIEKDDLWRGRFYVKQISNKWEKFEDNSGGILVCHIRVYDKKTNYYHDYIFRYAPFFITNYYHYCYDILNKFIVDDLDVWKNDNPRNDNADYRKHRIIENDDRKDNWYLNYQEFIVLYKGELYECNNSSN